MSDKDTVYRQAAIDELKRISFSHWFECEEYLSEDTKEIEIISSSKALEVIEALPSAQPGITLESAIDYLHSIGWMQEHDRTLTESVQPEIIHCESCEHWKNEHICECLSRYGTFETPKNFYCGYGKEK